MLRFCNLRYRNSQLHPVNLLLNIILVGLASFEKRLHGLIHAHDFEAVPNSMPLPRVYLHKGFESIGGEWSVERGDNLRVNGTLKLSF
jgi:hypothetical protein